LRNLPVSIEQIISLLNLSPLESDSTVDAMPRRMLWAVVVVLIAAVAATLALLAGGSGRERAAAPTRVAVVDAGHAVLLSQRSVRVSLRARSAGTLEVSTALRDPRGTRAAFAAREVAVPASGATTAAIELTPAQQELLRACRPLDLAVRAGARRAQVRLVPQPPTCGRFFAPDSIWNAPNAAQAQLDPASDAITASLLGQVAWAVQRDFGPTINQDAYSAAIHTVGRAQRRVPVVLDKDESWADGLRKELTAGVPIPPGARPARGADAHLVIWQPATDTMWELWKARREGGRWHAEWGGRMTGVSRNPGWFGLAGGVPSGGTASSLPMAGGLITQADLRRGRIDHALALAIPRPLAGWWSAPAQRTDGWVREPSAVPEGARFRLDPSFDVDALDAPPLIKEMAQAAQRYGIYVRDKSGTVTFYAEPASTGAGGDGAGISLDGAKTRAALRRFPWNRLQLTKLDLRTYRGSNPGPPPRPPAPAEPPAAKLCALPGVPCP
jgi:hypothetical protein